MIDLLLEYKANVNLTNKFGITPFMGACWSGDAAVVNKFLGNGADVNKAFSFSMSMEKTRRQNTTPLSATVQLGFSDIVRALLLHKADITI
jgi:ankyrin repeat protein